MSLARRVLLSVVLGLAGTLPCVLSLAQEGESAPTLRNTVLQIAAARSELLTFNVNVAATVEHKQLGAGVASDGQVSIPDKVIERFDMRLVMDTTSNQLQFARRNSFTNVDREARETTKGWDVFVDTPEFQVVRTAPHAAGVWEPGRIKDGIPQLFDPRILGLAFAGDIESGSTIAQVVGNYLQWPEMQSSILGDGQVRFDRGAKASQKIAIVVDTKRDYWPIENTFHNREDLVSATTTELAKVHDRWLPSKVVVDQPDKVTMYVFEWVSVNEPLPEEAFLPSSIGAEYAFAVEDHRGKEVIEQ